MEATISNAQNKLHFLTSHKGEWNEEAWQLSRATLAKPKRTQSQMHTELHLALLDAPHVDHPSSDEDSGSRNDSGHTDKRSNSNNNDYEE